MPEQRHALGSEPRHLEQLGHRRRHLPPQVLEQPTGPGLDDLPDLGGEVGSDARQLGEILAAIELLLHVRAEALQQARRVAVCTNAERVLTLDGQAIGDLFEDSGGGEILRGHVGKRSARAGSLRSLTFDARRGLRFPGSLLARRPGFQQQAHPTFTDALAPGAQTPQNYGFCPRNRRGRRAQKRCRS